ncbi:hypothetical protein C8R46DRAFT_1221046 [Mycena filopes]|nr:hypothetical protein C8R46DRAFT_1221046 [Mycena filopes]
MLTRRQAKAHISCTPPKVVGEIASHLFGLPDLAVFTATSRAFANSGDPFLFATVQCSDGAQLLRFLALLSATTHGVPPRCTQLEHMECSSSALVLLSSALVLLLPRLKQLESLILKVHVVLPQDAALRTLSLPYLRSLDVYVHINNHTAFHQLLTHHPTLVKINLGGTGVQSTSPSVHLPHLRAFTGAGSLLLHITTAGRTLIHAHLGWDLATELVGDQVMSQLRLMVSDRIDVSFAVSTTREDEILSLLVNHLPVIGAMSFEYRRSLDPYYCWSLAQETIETFVFHLHSLPMLMTLCFIINAANAIPNKEPLPKTCSFSISNWKAQLLAEHPCELLVQQFLRRIYLGCALVGLQSLQSHPHQRPHNKEHVKALAHQLINSNDQSRSHPLLVLTQTVPQLKSVYDEPPFVNEDGTLTEVVVLCGNHRFSALQIYADEMDTNDASWLSDI